MLSCSKTETPTEQTISGKLADKSITSISLFPQFEGNPQIIMIKNGQFSHPLKLDKPTTFMTKIGNERLNLFIDKGNSLVINQNKKADGYEVEFLGKDAAANEYLRKKIKLNSTTPRGRELYLKTEKEFGEILANIKTKEMELLNNSNSIPSSFKKLEQKHIQYTYLIGLLNFEGSYKYYTQNPDFKVSKEFAAIYEDINLDYDMDLFSYSSNYRGFLQNKSFLKAEKAVENGNKKLVEVLFLEYLKEIDNDEIRNWLAYDTSRFVIQSTSDLKEFFDAFSSVSTNQTHIEALKKEYEKLKPLMKGMPSPKFVNYENNAGGKTSLDDLQGKYVYIDVWATWCGPCIQEIPSLKKIEKQYHNKNIEFVSISIDKMKDHPKWKKMIVDKSLGGTQLLADKEWQSKFIQDYRISGIPRFILIDPKGNIVSHNAPRPSNISLINTFEELGI